MRVTVVPAASDGIVHVITDPLSVPPSEALTKLVCSGSVSVKLTDWAIGFQRGFAKRSRPRIGIHYGLTMYRDGDYYGQNVNLASRVVSRAHAGEVLVTQPVHDMSAALGVKFEAIGDVELKGFSEAMSLYIAREPAGPSA